jgi:phospholipid transport system substrate-binding protein
MRTQRILGVALVLVLAWPGAGLATGEDEAREIMQETIDQVMAVLQNDSLTEDQKVEEIKAVAEARFDFPRMTRLVLGRNYRKLSEQEREEFLVEFKQHLTVTYGKGLKDYSGENVAIDLSRLESNGDVTVKSRVQGGTTDGVKIDYRLRARDGSWYVIDVIIESVSLVANFRSQIQEIVSSKGTARLIEILREKNEKEAKAS